MPGILKQNMILTLQEAWKNKDNDLHLNNYKEVLILASIIEKETSLEEEKPKNAGHLLRIQRILCYNVKITEQLKTRLVNEHGMIREIE